MKLDSLTIYRIGREEINPLGRAIERLKFHPYGDLAERYKEWKEKPTRAMLFLLNRN